jgi:hypothetical protein
MLIRLNDLTSEKIRSQFGNITYSVTKLPDCRITAIKDMTESIKLLALVSFVDPVPEILVQAHHKVDNGKLIGETLRDEGFDFARITRGNYSLVLKNVFQFGDIIQRSQYSEFSVRSENSLVLYCEILEIFSKDFIVDLPEIEESPEILHKVKSILNASQLDYSRISSIKY